MTTHKTTRWKFLQPVKWLFILISFIVGVQIFMKTFEYYQPDFTHGFLKGKKEVFYSFYQYAFYVHIITAPIVLITGLLQFFKFIRIRFFGRHKALGFIYVFSVLLLAAPGGFIMGFYAIGGFWSVMSFMVLTPLWWWFTYMAFRYAKARNYAKHGLFMRRSMILTLSAVFLRIYAFIALWFYQDNSHETYTVISWLSWLPNLLIFEAWNYFVTLKEKK